MATDYEEKMANTDYTIDLSAEQKAQHDEKWSGVTDNLEQTYAGMIGEADNIYQPQIDALDQWEDEQVRIQNEQTQHTIDLIEQQKAQANKDYQKEQSGAYVDWRKQSNQYGTEAEKMASSGLMGTGYSESSQVSMYNTYQNRIAQARESYDRVIMNYNNSITEAKLQNNSALAEIAYNTLTKQLELITEGTMYKNSLILDLADKKLQVQQMADNDYHNLLDRIYQEKSLEQSDRQFYEKLDFEAEQAVLDRNHDKAMAEIQQQYEKDLAAINQQYKLDYLDAETEKEKELLDKQHKIAMKELAQKLSNDKQLLQKELENEKALLKYKYEMEKKYSTTTFSSGSGGSGGSTTTSKTSATTTKAKSASIPSNKPVNKDSVLSLGGPYSANHVASLVASGKASMTEKNGEIVFEKNQTYPYAAGGALKWNNRKN